MRRQDLRSVAGVVSAGGLNAVVTAVLGVITARSLGPGGQGELTVVTTAVAVVVVAAVLGTGTSLRLRGVPSPPDADVRAYSGLSLLLAPVGGLLSCGVVGLVGSVTGSDLLLVFIFGSAALVAYQASQLVQAYGSVARSLFAAGFGALTQVMVFATLALLGRASLSSAIWAGIAGAVAQSAFALASIRLHIAAFRPLRAGTTWRELIGHGWPTVGYSLGLVGMQRVDRLVLVAVAGPSVGGVYAVAVAVTEVVRISSSAIGQLLFVRSAGSQSTTESVRRIYVLAVVIQTAGIAALAALAPVLIPFIFGEAYVSAVPLVRGLLIGEFFMGLALMDARILLGHGRFRGVSTLTVAAFAASLPVYWLSILTWEAWGAVGGSIAIYATYSGCLLLMRVVGVTHVSVVK